MSRQPGTVILQLAAPHALPAGAPAGAPPPPPGPTYILQVDNILDVKSEAICICTDVNMQRDRGEYPPHDQEWFDQANGPAGPAGGVNGLQTAYNSTRYEAGVNDLTPNRVALSPAGLNLNHRVVIMVNIPVPATNHELRLIYWKALNEIRRLPHPIIAVLNDLPWEYVVTSVAFTLIGVPPLDVGYENAAEQALSAITGWFNHGQWGTPRRRAISTVYLLVPHGGNANGKDVGRIEFAWKRAWNRYITPNVDSTGILNGPRLSSAEHRRLLDNAEVYLHGSAAGTPGVAAIPRNNTYMTVPPPNLNPLNPDPAASVAENDRLNTRVLRSGRRYRRRP